MNGSMGVMQINRLTFAELEALAGFLSSGFLALHGTGIAGEQIQCAQLWLQL